MHYRPVKWVFCISHSMLVFSHCLFVVCVFFFVNILSNTESVACSNVCGGTKLIADDVWKWSHYRQQTTMKCNSDLNAVDSRTHASQTQLRSKKKKPLFSYRQFTRHTSLSVYPIIARVLERRKKKKQIVSRLPRSNNKYLHLQQAN